MEIVLSFWKVLVMMAPWLLVGFLLAGVVSVLLPRKWVVGVMGRARGWRGVLNAVLIGVPLPVCSCGVLPLTAGLRKAGAGKGAVAGFLISTPQTGIDSILATYALMGPVFAVARPVAAFATGLAGGVAVDVLTRGEADAVASEKPKKESHCCCCHCHEHAESSESDHSSEGNLFVRILRTGYGELLGDVARPLAVGLVIAAAVTAFVPANFFATAFGGNDWLAMPAMVLLGFPMYVCSTASIPIAASLVAKGLTPGAAFVFLMVGPAINAASMTAVAKMIGVKASVAYALVIAVGAVLCGVGINLLPFDVLPQVAADAASETLAWWEHLAAAVLVALVAHGLIKTRLQCILCLAFCLAVLVEAKAVEEPRDGTTREEVASRCLHMGAMLSGQSVFDERVALTNYREVLAEVVGICVSAPGKSKSRRDRERVAKEILSDGLYESVEAGLLKGVSSGDERVRWMSMLVLCKILGSESGRDLMVCDTTNLEHHVRSGSVIELSDIDKVLLDCAAFIGDPSALKCLKMLFSSDRKSDMETLRSPNAKTPTLLRLRLRVFSRTWSWMTIASCCGPCW